MPICSFRTFLLVLTSAFFVSSSRADMVISVTDGSLTNFAPGSVNQVDVTAGPGTVKLSVWAHDSALVPSGRLFNGFQLAFDISPTANTSISSSFNPATFSVSNSAVSNNLTLDLNRANRTNYDFLVNASSGVPVTTLPGSSTPVKLFDLSFQASQSTALGFYQMTFVPSATDTVPGSMTNVVVNTVLFTDFGGELPLVASGGQFRITAVPEPSSMLLVTCIGLALGYCWMRRRAAM